MSKNSKYSCQDSLVTQNTFHLWIMIWIMNHQDMYEIILDSGNPQTHLRRDILYISAHITSTRPLDQDQKQKPKDCKKTRYKLTIWTLSINISDMLVQVVPWSVWTLGYINQKLVIQLCQWSVRTMALSISEYKHSTSTDQLRLTFYLEREKSYEDIDNMTSLKVKDIGHIHSRFIGRMFWYCLGVLTLFLQKKAITSASL